MTETFTIFLMMVWMQEHEIYINKIATRLHTKAHCAENLNCHDHISHEALHAFASSHPIVFYGTYQRTTASKSSSSYLAAVA